MDLPQATYVRSLEVNGRKVKAVQSLEDILEEVEIEMPALISVVSEINEPRIPAVTQILRAGRKPKKILKPADFSVQLAAGRWVETLSNLAPVQERKGILFKEGLKELPGLLQALREEGVGRK